MPYTTIPSNIIAAPFQDMSVSRHKVEESGAILVSTIDYSSEYSLLWRCNSEAAEQYFAHRFVLSIDSWYDSFAIGPVVRTTLRHKTGTSNDHGDDTEHRIEIDFVGYIVWAFDENGEDKFFLTEDEAVEWINRPTE